MIVTLFSICNVGSLLRNSWRLGLYQIRPLTLIMWTIRWRIWLIMSRRFWLKCCLLWMIVYFILIRMIFNRLFRLLVIMCFTCWKKMNHFWLSAKYTFWLFFRILLKIIINHHFFLIREELFVICWKNIIKKLFFCWGWVRLPANCTIMTIL